MLTIKRESNYNKLGGDTFNKLHVTAFTVTGARLCYFWKPNPNVGDMLLFKIQISTVWNFFKTANVGRVIVTRA